MAWCLRQGRAESVQRHHASRLGEERSEAAVAAVGPQRLDHLLARDRPVAVRDEVRDEEPALPPGQVALDTAAVDLDDEPPAELHFRPGQLGANIDPTFGSYNHREPTKGGRNEQADHL